jgi:hypothetical protein
MGATDRAIPNDMRQEQAAFLVSKMDLQLKQFQHLATEMSVIAAILLWL